LDFRGDALITLFYQLLVEAHRENVNKTPEEIYTNRESEQMDR
jgi:hypothetical protein